MHETRIKESQSDERLGAMRLDQYPKGVGDLTHSYQIEPEESVN